ncbi:ImmA/IrrE family metallo-endopeptidase [Thiolapillus sp.]
MSREDIARSSRLPVSVVEGYFRGKREIYFPELSSICQTLGTDVLWITSKNYQSSRLAYRGVSEAAKKSAEGIEHAISLVLDLFQKSSRPRVEPIGESIDDAKLLLMEVDKRAGEFREQFHTIQSLFECHQINLLGVSEQTFDGFMLALGKYCFIVADKSRPTVRLTFTLLHEFAHFVFDIDKPIPVDENLFALSRRVFSEKIGQESRAEFIANKFAQCYLVPVREAAAWLKTKHPERQAGEYAHEHKISPEVTVNAYLDAARMSGKRLDYLQTLDEAKRWAGNYAGDESIREFVQNASKSLSESLNHQCHDYGDEQWQLVSSVFGANATCH